SGRGCGGVGGDLRGDHRAGSACPLHDGRPDGRDCRVLCGGARENDLCWLLRSDTTVSPMSLLHILNGDHMAGGLRQSGVPGEYAKWIDLFYEGPVSGDSGSDSFRRARAKYLSSAGYGERDSILRSLRDQDRLLARSHEYVEVVLWFEHDLFDQLLLARHLDWLSRNPSAASRVHLIQSDRYLGPMQPEELAALYPTRTPVTPLQVASGSDAWRAVCADSPMM